MIARCCKCGRINISGLWIEKVPVNTSLTETYCPKCRKNIISEAKRVLKGIKDGE